MEIIIGIILLAFAVLMGTIIQLMMDQAEARRVYKWWLGILQESERKKNVLTIWTNQNL